MTLLYSFILKDIREFRNSKKILLSALICILYPTIINIIADQPLIPIQLLIIPASIFTACFGMEFLYLFTINEIKYRIFDIFLVSKIGKLQLLLCKLALPAMFSFLLALMSVVINNIVVLLFPQYGFVSGAINFETIILFISSAIISTLIQFGAIIIIDKFDAHTHTFTIFISFLMLICMYIANLIFGIYIFIALAVCVIFLLVLFNCRLINLYIQTTSLKKRYNLKSIFPDRNISDISALLRKEIIISGFNFFAIIRLIMSSMFPIIINSFMINDLELSQALFRTALYFICIFGVINILFPVIKEEQINRYTDVFIVAKINKFKLYFSKCILPFCAMLIGLVLCILLTWIYCNKTNNIFILDPIAIITSIFSTCFSILITFLLSHYIYSYKDVRIIGFFIMVISFIFHVIISFTPYWIF